MPGRSGALRRWLLWAMLGLLAFSAAAAAALELASGPAAEAPALALDLAASSETAEFARALAPRPLQFPADHGPHLEFQTEWWYYIGNLQTQDGHHLGFQLTFFRRGLQPGQPDRPSSFAASHIYSAHLALTDTARGEHRAWERFSRGAAGLAGAQAAPYRVWLDDWSVQALRPDGDAVRLFAQEEDFLLDLKLTPQKLPTLHGDAGLSRKGPEPGNASYYVSLTRLSVVGRVQTEDLAAEVDGLAWFDHEWGTTSLGPQAVGWDWFGLQLEDGRELMAFQIRRQDGTIELASGGTLVQSDGSARTLGAHQLTIEPLGSWTSPENGAVYPSGWRLTVPEYALELLIEPRLEDQENRLSIVYWEGAVNVRGTAAGEPLSGQGYAELTGYAQPLRGDF